MKKYKKYIIIFILFILSFVAVKGCRIVMNKSIYHSYRYEFTDDFIRRNDLSECFNESEIVSNYVIIDKLSDHGISSIDAERLIEENKEYKKIMQADIIDTLIFMGISLFIILLIIIL